MLLNLIANGGGFMTKEEIAFRKRLEALPQMTNREAMEIVLDAAELYVTLMEEKSMDFKHEHLDDAIWQIQDYKNDLMRKEN